MIEISEEFEGNTGVQVKSVLEIARMT